MNIPGKIFYDDNQLQAFIDDRAIATIVFNNPDQLNALNLRMAEGAKQLAPLLKANKPRVVIFRGKGKAFSAGGDLEYLQSLTVIPRHEIAAAMHSFYVAFLQLVLTNCPSIALITGPAIGAGFCISMACDMRFAAKGVQVGLNFVRIGLNPGMATEFFASHRMPSALAHEMILTGKIYTTDELEKYHLFNTLGAVDAIEKKAYETAETISDNSPLSISYSLQLMRNLPKTLPEVLVIQANGQGDCLSQGQVTEALIAQRKKERFRFAI